MADPELRNGPPLHPGKPYGHPKELWLAPWCPWCKHSDNSDTGRQWCEDNVFEDCEECGRRAERYVVAPAERNDHTSHCAVIMEDGPCDCGVGLKEAVNA